MADDSWLARIRKSGYLGDAAQIEQNLDDNEPTTITKYFSNSGDNDDAYSKAIKRVAGRQQGDQPGS